MQRSRRCRFQHRPRSPCEQPATTCDPRKPTTGRHVYRGGVSPSLPKLQFFLGQWLEKFATDGSFALQTTELASWLGGNRNDLGNRLAAAGKHDFLSGFGTRHELGEIGLGRVDGEG